MLHTEPGGELVQELRTRFDGPLVANSGFGRVTTREEAVALIDAAHADAVAVGRPVIANPDLVERWAGEHPENEPNAATFYAAGAEGYTDYPLLARRLTLPLRPAPGALAAVCCRAPVVPVGPARCDVDGSREGVRRPARLPEVDPRNEQDGPAA